MLGRFRVADWDHDVEVFSRQLSGAKTVMEGAITIILMTTLRSFLLAQNKDT